MLNVVKILESTLDAGRRTLKFLRFGKNDVQTSLEAMPFGDDSQPVKNMKAIYGKTSDNGKTVIIGYINEEQIADTGEKRIYSTNSSGNPVMYLHLKNDGTAEFNGNADNMVRYSKLELAFNTLKAEHNALVTLFNTHVHVVVGAVPLAPPIPPTALIPPVPGVPSVANILPAKINEIKTTAV